MDEWMKRLAEALQRYREVSQHAGVNYPCLNEGWDREANPVCAVTHNEDTGEMVVRIDGPMDGFLGFSARRLVRQIDAEEPTALRLLISSPGGYMSEGQYLYSELRSRHNDGMTITAEARGVVASAAVLPYLAADTRSADEASSFMLHAPWSGMILIGSASEIEKQAKSAISGLKNAEKTLAQIYEKRSTLDAGAIAQIMDEDTWYTAEEADAVGIVTEISELDPVDHTPSEAEAQAMAMAERIMESYRPEALAT